VRASLVLFVLFRALTAIAQPVVGDEIASGPLTLWLGRVDLAVPAVAMAKDQDGVAIAWTMFDSSNLDAIFVARLADGVIHEIPRYSTFDRAALPSIAASPSGRGFTMAWIERTLNGAAIARVVLCHLDSDLTPSAPSLLPLPFQSNAISPIMARGSWITIAGLVWPINDDGSAGAPINAGIAASDMTAATGFPQLVSSNRKVEPSLQCTCITSCRGFCPCPSACVVPPKISYVLQLTALYTTSLTQTFEFDSALQPAVLNNGRDVMIVWFRGSESKGGEVVAAHLDPITFTSFDQLTQRPQVIGKFGPDSGQTRPDIATDGDHTLVVWRTTSGVGHDIVGAWIDRDGKITPLSIATSAADERDPSVIATGPGTFLVAYEKIYGFDRRIAGRYVMLPERRRAVR
jgi:hypothetical protein